MAESSFKLASVGLFGSGVVGPLIVKTKGPLAFGPAGDFFRLKRF